MKARAQVKNKELIFASPAARALFFQRNEGKEVYIIPDEAPSSEIRRYFEGCLVPVYFYCNPASQWVNFAECREALKVNWLGKEQMLMDGKKQKIAPSLADLNRDRFKWFVEQVTNDLIDHFQVDPTLLDGDTWKYWRDSVNEEDIYPPLQKLKVAYEIEKAKAFPWRIQTK